jgi:hypothetical protein
MIMFIVPRLSRGPLGRIVAAFRVRLRRLRSTESERYHPERHYMRGPGPRALAKGSSEAHGRGSDGT